MKQYLDKVTLDFKLGKTSSNSLVIFYVSESDYKEVWKFWSIHLIVYGNDPLHRILVTAY